MPEIGPSGTARGAARKGRPYRDFFPASGNCVPETELYCF